MYCSVVFLRHRGIKRADIDVSNSRPLVGDLTMSTTRGVRSIDLQARGIQIAEGHLARLTEPELTGMGNGILRFRGIERMPTDLGDAAVFQEWLVTVISR